MVTIVQRADEEGDWISCSIVLLVGVQLELLALVAGPAIRPLSWDLTARWFALFAAVDRRLTEQRRNR